MTENIVFAKLVTGEMVLAEKDEAADKIKNVCLVQVMPTQSGSMQIAIVPYGFPFEEEVRGGKSIWQMFFSSLKKYLETLQTNT